MAIQDIILRSSSHAPLTTKGSELTYGELDGNFIDIYDAITSLNDVSGIAPFNIGTTYTGTEYVSFNANVYVHISATPTTGVLPDTDPTKWQLTSTGALAHQQNTDTYLAYGSASQVSATDLADIINNQNINITYANFTTAKDNGTLKVNRLYCITDTNAHLDNIKYVNSEIKLYIRTIANNQYSSRAFISFVAPNYSTYSVYDFTYPYVVGDIVGYGLFVYECTNDTINGDTPNFATGDWSIKSYISFPALYETRIYDVDFMDDFGIFYFRQVYDRQNNVFGSTDFENANIVSSPVNYSNEIDSTSYWNNLSGNVFGVYTNRLLSGSSINSKGGYTASNIGSNYLVKSAINCDEFFFGTIVNNQLHNVNLFMQDGSFYGNLSNLKIEFANNTVLNLDPNTDVGGGYMNEQGSNISVVIDISTTTGTIDLDSILGSSDIYGEFKMDCNANNIQSLIKTNSFCPIIIKPNTSANYLTLNIDSKSATADNHLVSSVYSGNIDLYTDNGDYAILERVVIAGNNLWNITFINQIL